MTRAIPRLLLALVLAGCAAIDLAKIERAESHALADPEATALGGMLAPAAAHHRGRSGFLLLDKGESSLLWRGALAEAAERTIDAQYYIWSDDNVGTIAAERLLDAAARGVRVRVLVDDFFQLTDPRHLAFLDAHPNVEVRLYNPAAARSPSMLVRVLSAYGDFARHNRRMHNKVYVVDNSLAIIGGRNVADEYFDMHAEFNFRDRDLLVAGPIVPQISESFDLYWNSIWSVPVSEIIAHDESAAERQAWYDGLRAYAADPVNFPDRFHPALAETRRRLAGVAEELIWARARLFYDLPGKNEDLARLDAYGLSGEALTQAALATRRELLAQTPYLVLLPGTFEVVDMLRERGVSIRVLTNSLASTDGVPPFSCYARQRQELLRRGVELYEMRPDGASQQLLMERLALAETRPRWSLHAKTAVFDREKVYVGSFNMDPRSTHLNTEIGVLIESPELAEQIAAIIEDEFSLENSWRLELGPDGALSWHTIRAGKPVTARDDPGKGLLDGLGLALVPLVLACDLV